MEIFKTDILKKEFKKFQKENLVKYSNVVIIKRLLVNLFIESFWLVANFVGKHFVKAVTILTKQKKYFLKDLIKLENNILKTLLKIFLV